MKKDASGVCESALKLKEKELEVLYLIDSLLDEAEGLDSFLDELAVELKKITGAGHVFIFLYDKSGKKLEKRACAGSKSCAASLLAADKSAKKCLDRKTEVYVATGKPVSRKVGGFFAMPMLPHDRTLGAVVCEVGQKGFGDEAKHLLRAALRQADSAIENLAAKEESARRISELTMIAELDAVRDSSNDAREIMARSLDVMGRYVHIDRSVAVIINDITGHTEIVAKGGGANIAWVTDSWLLAIARDAMAKKKEIAMRVVNMRCDVFAMPVILGEKEVFGAFVLASKKTSFGEREAALLRIAESQLDTALDHARLFGDLVRKNKELDLIYSIDRIRDTMKNLDEMLSGVLAKIVSTIGTEAGFIILYNDDGGMRDLKMQGNISSRGESAIKRFSYSAIKTGNHVFLNDAGSGIRSLICVPLILETQLIGTFGIINPVGKKYFDTEDEKLLAAVASQADTAIFEDLTKQEIKSVFKRYVNEKVVDKMLNANKEEFLTGQRLRMSVLFADMRGFTAMSERLADPEKLVAVINEYLSAMTDEVMKHDGTLDKFVGDEVMALFGAPLHYPNHAAVAVRTAIAMQKSMEQLKRKWKREGKEPCSIGIGINTGDMVAGNIGCDKVTSYTVLGDNVNLGARLCGNAKPKQILIAESVYKDAKEHFKFNLLEPIKVKGKANPINVYEVIY
ncbi:MAG: adenylate/guanylate cyclase domain-containing protein [bacterium]